jgi:Fe-S protein assembly chaperone HscA
MSKIIGIDLGTTNSLVAVFRDGRPEVIRETANDARIPSVIYFPEQGSPIVGRAAREYAYTDPERTLFSVKRLMGRGLADVRDDLRSVPFPASETEHGVLQLEIRGRKYTPQELSALILMRVHDVACQHIVGLGMLDRVVITVPAYFDDAQRQATRDAARLANLEVVRFVNEPTAASLAYGLDQKQGGTIAVYDLGGGTFDISLLSIEDGVFRVLSTAGDTHLGGDDLDRALVEVALAELRPRLGAAADDPAFQRGLHLAAEKCKIELSRAPEADFHFVVPERGLTWHTRITREAFEALIEPLLARTFDATRLALSDAGLQPSAVEEVVLVGGSTRIPAVRRQVEAFFGRPPHCELNPDEVVALGAAVQGHVLAGGTRDILLMDVTPLSLGLETMGGAVAKVIMRNSPIPCQHTEGFTTYADNQTGMDFNVVQGERELASDCRTLGRFKLTGIPPMPAGMARVLVRFQLDADGILKVTAKEESTGTRAEIAVQPMHGLTDGEVETMLKESFEHAREDFEASLLANLKTELGTMIRASETHLPNARRELDRETVAELEDALRAGREARDSGTDHKAVQRVRDALERATLPLAAVLMDSVAKRALTGKKLDEV